MLVGDKYSFSVFGATSLRNIKRADTNTVFSFSLSAEMSSCAFLPCSSLPRLHLHVVYLAGDDSAQFCHAIHLRIRYSHVALADSSVLFPWPALSHTAVMTYLCGFPGRVPSHGMLPGTVADSALTCGCPICRRVCPTNAVPLF